MALSFVRIGIAATALGSMSCTLFAELDAFTGGAPAAPATDTATKVAAGAGDAGDVDDAHARDAASVPDGSAAPKSDGVVDVPGSLLDDDFETGSSCHPWQAAYGTAELVTGGYESARACLICRQGDIYVDRTVPTPGRGTMTIEAWSRRVTTTAPTSTVYVHAIINGPEGLSDEVATTSLTSVWTKSLVSVTVPAGVPTVKLRIRVEEGCFALDRVRAQFQPAAD